MIYRIEAFDRKTEFLVFEEELPPGFDENLAAIMSWSSKQQGWEGYDLSNDQLASLEKLIGKNVFDPKYTFQLTCNGR
ncbi:hypothetical protein [Pseudomonas sp. Irchel s3a12]|uniref:DUF7683 domain-containing protein n=1 Tax=Pseudomonas sp. Irchel s3a12 TaxID=2009047 RepID=UPI000BA369F7|nr:hypothetical protein [Pseudomonas sp. Irchel s3a12]